MWFQPTLPLRGATHRAPVQARVQAVSTHAPLAGSDMCQATAIVQHLVFQPTLPLRGATDLLIESEEAFWFQPTLPLRGATTPCTCGASTGGRFNPRSPCGERHQIRALHGRRAVSTHAPLAGSDVDAPQVQGVCQVSTHAPLAGSDRPDSRVAVSTGMFQPTLPLRGATRLRRARRRRVPVSTHAPLAGSDLRPRHRRVQRRVSTHAPLAGSDKALCARFLAKPSFNPRSPCGERLYRPRHCLY